MSVPALKKRFLSAEEAEGLTVLSTSTTSKKDTAIRTNELVKIVQKPLEKFFEEKLSYYLSDINSNIVLKSLCTAIVQNGTIGESDLMDELLRAVQRKTANDPATPTEKYIMMGHPDVHRLLKDLVKAECVAKTESKEPFKLLYSEQMAKILLKNFDDVISTRAVFILIEMLENECTKPLVFKQVNAKKETI